MEKLELNIKKHNITQMLKTTFKCVELTAKLFSENGKTDVSSVFVFWINILFRIFMLKNEKYQKKVMLILLLS